MIAAAMASNSRPFAIELLPDESCADCRRPVTAAVTAEMAMTELRMVRTLMPESSADLALPPTA